MESRIKVLLVEDDPVLALGLSDSLSFEGYQVERVASGESALTSFEKNTPDIVILDLMLPDLNGYQVCERLRRDDEEVPILMLTARSQEADKIRGLEAGADDYVTKPFSVGELAARIRALLRRANRSSASPVIAPAVPAFNVGEAVVDAEAHTITLDGEVSMLSFYENELMKLLYAEVGKPVSRDTMLDRIWGLDASPTNRTVDNFIVKLRKKLEPQPDAPRHILTVYGVGYKLVL